MHNYLKSMKSLPADKAWYNLKDQKPFIGQNLVNMF